MSEMTFPCPAGSDNGVRTGNQNKPDTSPGPVRGGPKEVCSSLFCPNISSTSQIVVIFSKTGMISDFSLFFYDL